MSCTAISASNCLHHCLFVADIYFYVFLVCRTSTTTVAAPLAGAPKLPSEITGKTVEEVYIYHLPSYDSIFS